MCNRYFQPPRERINFFRILSVPDTYKGGDVFPRGQGSFLRTSENGGDLELIIGQWGLVPHFAKSKALPYSTNNARIEGVSTAASFRQPMVPWPALHHSGRHILGTLLGIWEERMVVIPTG